MRKSRQQEQKRRRYRTCAEVYSAAAKFESGCGWPAFDKCYAGAVKTKPEGQGCAISNFNFLNDF